MIDASMPVGKREEKGTLPLREKEGKGDASLKEKGTLPLCPVHSSRARDYSSLQAIIAACQELPGS